MRRALLVLITLSAVEFVLERRSVFLVTGLSSIAMLVYKCIGVNLLEFYLKETSTEQKELKLAADCGDGLHSGRLGGIGEP